MFLSLILFVLIMFILSMLSALRLSMGKKSAYYRSFSGAWNMLADYCIPLREDYGLFAIDGGYDTADLSPGVLERNLHDDIERNNRLIPSGDDVVYLEKTQIDELTMLMDSSYENLKKEIHDFCLYQLSIERTKDYLEELGGINDSLAMEKGVIGELEKARNIEKGGETGISEETVEPEEQVAVQHHGINGMDDPRTNMTNISAKGVLWLTLPQGFEISSKYINEGCCYKRNNAATLEEIRNFKSYDDVLGNIASVESAWSGVEEELILDEYVTYMFKNAVKKESKRERESALDYETEFIISGRSKDKDNLKNTAQRILLLRTAINSFYLLNSPGKSASARALAEALTMGVPFLKNGVYYLIITTWAYGEGCLDCRALYDGGKVELMKNDSNWKLSLSGLMKLTAEGMQSLVKSDEKGLEYEDYLKLLLLMVPNSAKYSRIGTLIENNIRMKTGYENFCIANCIFGFKATMDFDIGILKDTSVSVSVSY